jgi:hypothetical protein
MTIRVRTVRKRLGRYCHEPCIFVFVVFFLTWLVCSIYYLFWAVAVGDGKEPPRHDATFAGS